MTSCSKNKSGNKKFTLTEAIDLLMNTYDDSDIENFSDDDDNYFFMLPPIDIANGIITIALTTLQKKPGLNVIIISLFPLATH